MKSQEIFEICHARYRAARRILGRSVASVDLEIPSCGYQWRPERARASEYVADFEMVGERALRRPEWAGRLRLFRIYFCRGVEYKRAIVFVGVPEGTFDWWMQEVKKSVGRELDRAGLFPPSKYFRQRG